MNPLATLRIGSLEIVGALAFFAAVAAVPRTRAVPDVTERAAGYAVARDRFEFGSDRRAPEPLVFRLRGRDGGILLAQAGGFVAQRRVRLCLHHQTRRTRQGERARDPDL